MDKFIRYFKSLADREEDAQNWHEFWELHKKELAEYLSRGSYLRIKEYPLKEIYNILSKHGYEYPRPSIYRHWKFHRQDPVPKAYLSKKISKQEVIDKLNNKYDSDSLRAILEKLEPEDEFWSFSSRMDPRNKNKRGVSGIAVVREGIPYDSVILLRI